VRDFLADPLAVDVTAERTRRQTWEHLARWSGFPEPFLKGQDDFYTLWSRQYLRQIIREDIVSLAAVQKVGQMELLLSLLPTKVGSPLALHNLAGDLGVSFDSVKSWLGVFESFFLAFQVSPWTRKVARAILKEKKVYLLNPALVAETGARFENQVAVELWRAVHAWSEAGLGDFSLHYVRTKDGLEVDFLIAERQRPLLLVEAKQGDAEPAAPLLKLQSQLQVPAVQLVNRPGIYRHAPGARPPLLVISAEHWLAGLP
jgi:predicted AAA+ superfamily ATPase